MARPRDWVARVNRPPPASELEALRVSVQRGRPFGEEGWARRMAKRFGMESTFAAAWTAEGRVNKDALIDSTLAATKSTGDD